MKKPIPTRTSVALVVTAALIMASPAFAAEITGIPRIVDGDTVEIGQVKMRLSGIDAPEDRSDLPRRERRKMGLRHRGPRRANHAFQRVGLGMHNDRHRPIQ